VINIPIKKDQQKSCLTLQVAVSAPPTHTPNIHLFNFQDNSFKFGTMTKQANGNIFHYLDFDFDPPPPIYIYSIFKIIHSNLVPWLKQDKGNFFHYFDFKFKTIMRQEASSTWVT
jgi:hypothetical protein